jgi:predicted RNA binding protein YcfA (HicA-like mRNA interferase family)
MRLPRDLRGQDLVALLQRHYGYRLVRQRGSHLTVVADRGDKRHSVTIPRHRSVSVGTLSGIVGDVAAHFAITQAEVRSKLFGR